MAWLALQVPLVREAPTHGQSSGLPAGLCLTFPPRVSPRYGGACFGFDFATRPGPGRSGLTASGFQEFVELNALDVVDRYAAYPRSTAIDVRQAILSNQGAQRGVTRPWRSGVGGESGGSSHHHGARPTDPAAPFDGIVFVLFLTIRGDGP